jgi:hypothetical protein
VTVSRFDTYNRVWDHARQRGLKKLLLLALARHANAQGISWPSAETLCALTGESDPAYIRRTLAELVAENAITKNPGGGRGNITVYGILVGLTPADTETLRSLVCRARVKGGELTFLPENSGLQSTVSPNVSAENSGLQSTVLDKPLDKQWTTNNGLESTVLDKQWTPISGLQSTDCNPLIGVSETVDYSPETEVPNLASPSPKTPQNEGGNYYRTIGGGDVGGAAEKNHAAVPKRASRNGTPPHVAYLSRKGMGAAHLFADCDPEATIADFDARLADNWTISAIVTAWKQIPPRPGAIYEQRRHETPESRPERPAPARSPGRPRPGDLEYYTKSRKA